MKTCYPAADKISTSCSPLSMKMTIDECVYGSGRYLELFKFLQCLDSLSQAKEILLFQAVIDLQHQSLYYWPKPKPCLLWWMLIHSIVILLLLNEIMCCFYSFSGQDCWFPNAKNLSCHNQSNVHIIISLIMFIIEEIFIIFGMKIVMKVLENHKKEAI